MEKAEGFISTVSPAAWHQPLSFKRMSERETPAVCLWHDARPALVAIWHHRDELYNPDLQRSHLRFNAP